VSRKSWLALLIAASTIAGWLYFESKQAPAQSKITNRQSGDCRAVKFEGRRFTQCIASPGKHRIMTHVTGSDGMIYRGFGRLEQDIGSKDIAFAVNGGMYNARSVPIGYYVEKGERLRTLNRSKGDGNFYLLPNGIFFGDANGGWQILSTDQFADRIDKRPEFGTQSGPMLLIGGAFHPQISESGKSAKIRNAVGVDSEGRAHFVISDEPVTFGTLARMMRDNAKTPNALFLDGTVSALWHPASRRKDDFYPLGPLIVVTKLQKGGSS
jgi:uncharacterized protein YigE (DUF2233 family)